MRDDFTGKLRSGSADFAASVAPAPPEAIRARGGQRRRRQVVTAAVLAFAIGAGGAGTAYASLGRTGALAPAAGRTPSAAPTVTGGPGRPDIVAVTAKGALAVLDPLTGEARRILVHGGVAGGAVTVSPDGRTVYFGARRGCQEEIESVPVAGGRPAAIAPGALPAVSPDGTKLAFARQQPGGTPGGGCDYQPAADQVVVRDLAGGGETVLPWGAGAGQPVPVTGISWAPDGRRLLVSSGPVKYDWHRYLAVVDPATSRYYLPSVANGGTAVPAAEPPGTRGDYYYRDGVFLPDGKLFVNVVCCGARVQSSLMLETDTSGHLIREVAIGFRDRDHTSLGADPSGHWLLYLSGPDLFLSLDGAAPFKLTTGLTAAAWT